MANPDPSPSTRFGAEGGNPTDLGGKTAKQRQDEYKASQIAAELRMRALSVMQERADEGEDILSMIDANTLKLFKDSEDRAHGTPKAFSEVSGPEGGPIPVSQVTYEIIDPRDAD